jgi:hypothetical protein
MWQGLCSVPTNWLSKAQGEVTHRRATRGQRPPIADVSRRLLYSGFRGDAPADRPENPEGRPRTSAPSEGMTVPMRGRLVRRLLTAVLACPLAYVLAPPGDC